MARTPERGEVWLTVPSRDLVGHEQQGVRPVVIVSTNAVNVAAFPMYTVVPLTTTDRGIPLHVRIVPPDGGVREPCVAMVEHIHGADRQRFRTCWGQLNSSTMDEISDRLRILLQL